MGYDVHITRKAMKSQPSQVSREEWLAYVDGDPSMRLDDVQGFAEVTSPSGEIIRMPTPPGRAVWEDATTEAWFHYSEDKISVRNPDGPTLQKMYEISTKLSATVHGDDGEHYDSQGKPIGLPKEPVAETKPWWRFWS